MRVISLLMLLMVAVLPGCTSKPLHEDSPEDSKKILAYTSFYTMYDFAQKIGGSNVNLSNLVPAGTEPHDWEPKPSDIARLGKAEVLIYNGAGMEPWIDRVLQSINNPKLVPVESAKGIRLLSGIDESRDTEYDPHVWLNPMLAKKQMESIKEAFVQVDPANQAFYENSYADNAKKLDALDQEFRDAASRFGKKDFVVAHKAFSYMSEAYGLNQVAIEGLAADSEPSPARMAEIVQFVRQNNIKYIFFEELLSPKVAEAIARETGAATGVLNPLEGLTERDLEAGKEYFSIMRSNLELLKKSLR